MVSGVTQSIVRWRRCLLATAGGLAGLGLATAVQAQAVPPSAVDNAARQADAIQREQQQRTQQQQNETAASPRPPTELQAPVAAPPIAASGGRCRDITSVELLDAKQIPAGDKAAIVKPYLGRCLTAEDVGALLAAVTRFYIDHGYATTRAYIPGQDLSTGRLQILVVEGRVSGLKLNGKGVNLADAFPGVVGGVLNLRDFEQGLDQINRLLSNNATLDIQPGAAPGDSVVAINNKPTSPFHIALSYDNDGVRTTGQDEGSATLSVDHPLGINDYLSYTRTQSYFPSRGADASDSNSFFYSVPYGYTTLSLGGSTSSYRNQVTTPSGQVLDLSGDSDTAYVKLERMIYRSQTTRITAGIDLTAKIFDNDLDGQRLVTSSRDLTVVDLTLSANRNLPNGFVSANVAFSQGLKLFDALHDPSGLPDDAPRAQYERFTFGASYYGSFPFAGRTISLSSQLAGQYSLDVLYATEQFSIGGPYTVRGFYDSFLANDDGAYIRNDLSITQPLGQALGRPMSVRPYIGFDAGFVSNGAKGTPKGDLVSASVGFAFNISIVSVDFFVGCPIASPSTVHQGDFNPFARVSLSF